MSLTTNAYTFIQRLSQDTGLNKSVLAGWVMAETSGYNTTNGPNNWLNVGSFDSGFIAGGANVWDDPVSAADATASFMSGKVVHGKSSPVGPGSSSIRAILSTAGQGIGSQVAAIQDSDWAKSHYGYNLIADVEPFLKGRKITIGPGPSGGIVRPGGSGTSSATEMPVTATAGNSITSDYAALYSSSRQAPQDVSFGSDLLAPFKWFWSTASGEWKTFYKDVESVPDATSDAVDVFGETVKIMELLPWYVLRFCEFVTGMTFMGIGLYMTAKPSGRTGIQSGPARALRTVVGATVIGREAEKAGALLAGRREGRQEHYRLQGRREVRSKMSQSQAKQTQQAGQKRRDSN